MIDIRRMFNRICRDSARYVREFAGIKDLNQTEVDTIRHLVVAGSPICQQELADWLGVDKSFVTRMLVKLEHNGYVVRLSDPNSARNKLVTFTEKSVFIRESAAAAEDRYYDWLLCPLSPEERLIFLDIMERLFLRVVPEKDNAERS